MASTLLHSVDSVEYMIRLSRDTDLETALQRIPPLSLPSLLAFLTDAGGGPTSPSCTMTAMHHLKVENLTLWLDPEVVAAHLGSPEKV